MSKEQIIYMWCFIMGYLLGRITSEKYKNK